MKKFFFVASLSFIVLTITGCGLGQHVRTAEDTLNEAIRKLETNSDSWQNVLEETRDELIQEGQSTLANEVSNVLSRATSDIGIEAKCYTDFLRDRTREDLIRLRATITNEHLELIPVFCNPTPSSIDMNLPPDRRPIIEIAGYNLTKDSIQVFLVDTQSGMLDVSNSLDNPTNYLLTIILDRVPLTEESERLIFKFSNGEEKSIGIIKAYSPPEEVFVLSHIHITGSINMNDDENIVADEDKIVTVDVLYPLLLADISFPYHWEDCVGDEVQGYLDVQMQLDSKTGIVSGQGSLRYYEGTECGETDLQGYDSFNFSISEGQSSLVQRNLSDGDGGIMYNLNFKNESVGKVTQ